MKTKHQIEPVFTSLDKSAATEGVWDELLRLWQHTWHRPYDALEPVWNALWPDGWRPPPEEERPAQDLPLERALDELCAIRQHCAAYGEYRGKTFVKFEIDEHRPIWAAIADVLNRAGSDFDAERRELHALELKLTWVAGYVGAEDLLGIEPDETPNEPPFISLMSTPWKAQNWAEYVLVGELEDGDDRFKSFDDVRALERFLLEQQHKQKRWLSMSDAWKKAHPRMGVMRAYDALLGAFKEAGEEGATLYEAVDRMAKRKHN